MTRAHGTAGSRAAWQCGRRDGGLALRMALAVGSALCLIEALTATAPSPAPPTRAALSSRPIVLTVAAHARPADRDRPSAAPQCVSRGAHRVRHAGGG